MPRIFVIGSSNTDMVIKSKSLPAPGETIIGGTFLMNPGGKGANQAVAAAKLGGSVTFACKLGNDIFGHQALEVFEQAGINTEFIVTDHNQPSGVALILVDDAGENAIAVASGANANITTEELEKLIGQVGSDDIVLIQLEIPISVVEHVIQLCHRKGSKVILNPAPANLINDNTFQFISIITPNQTEAELLTGVSVTDLSSAAQAASVFHLKGVSSVVITMGSKGAYVSSGDMKTIVPSPTVTSIDSTAAGDVFNGAMAVGLAEGNSLEASVHFACKAASISVTRMGAQSSAPFRSEL